MGKKQGSVTYSTDHEDEVISKIFIISLLCCLTGSETISIDADSEMLQISDAPGKQNESV